MKTQPRSLPIILVYILTALLLPFPVAILLTKLSQNGILPELSQDQTALYLNMAVYVLLPVYCLIYYHKKIAADTKSAGKLLILVVPLILMIYGTSILGGLFIQYLDHAQTTDNQAFLDNLKNLNIYFTAYMAIVAAPITEESVFRCAMLKQHKGFAGFFLLILSSALFSLAHAINFSPGAFLAYFVIGLSLGLIYMKYRNLILNILVHGGYNALALVLSTFFYS